MTWSDLCLKDPAGFWVEKALGVESVCTHRHALTCTHKHVCTQAHASTHIHAHTHAYEHVHLHTCTRARTHILLCTHPASPAPDLLQNQGLLGAVPSPCRGLSCPPCSPPDPRLDYPGPGPQLSPRWPPSTSGQTLCKARPPWTTEREEQGVGTPCGNSPPPLTQKESVIPDVKPDARTKQMFMQTHTQVS